MSKKVHVILLEDVDSLGKAGDVVEVAEGYARNSLFVEGKAALATDKVRKEHTHQTLEQEKKESEELRALQKQADEYDGSELAIEARVKEGDEIYGSVTARDISERFNEQASASITPKDVVLESAIHKLGSYAVTVRLSPEVEFALNVTVVPDAESKKKLDDDEKDT